MPSIKHALPYAAMLLLAGCGSTYDCSNDEVIDTVGEALVDSMLVEKFKARINDGVKINDIVTLGVNKDVDHYNCKATFSYADPTGQTISKDLEYDVSQVESGDSAFEIAYDESTFRAFVYLATGAEREKAVEEWNEKNRRANRAALMASLKPIPREEALQQLREKFKQNGNPPTVAPTQLDPGRDDVEDYVVLAPWYGIPEGETEPRQTHLLFCVHQESQEEGNPMALVNGPGFPLPADVVPAKLIVKDANINIQTEDQKELPFSCSNTYVSSGHI